MAETLTVSLFGLGLIGGSLAQTIRRKMPGAVIKGLDVSKATVNRALLEKTIDEGMTTVTPSFLACDFLFLCAPLAENSAFLSENGARVSAGTIMSDTGSVKSAIMATAHETRLAATFIGGHPMAGSEKSGYEAANDRLFENAYYIITPSDDTPPEALSRLERFLGALDALPLVVSCAEHDQATAIVSHLPHVVAYALVSFLFSHASSGFMAQIAAGGFRDITRIAQSDPRMWSRICLANKACLVASLTSFMETLSLLAHEIEQDDEDALLAFFTNARDERASLSRADRGVLPRVHELHCDIEDEAGAIATIATTLATNGISIKNIGIVHDRTFEEGVLRIEFYDAEALSLARRVLARHHYPIHEKG